MMESAKKILKGGFCRKTVIYFLTWCLVLNTSLPAVLAMPADGVFTHGTGTIEYGTNTAVTVNQAQSIIQWGAPGSGGIDTGAAESLTFSQVAGLSNSAVLNRIMSGSPTQFDGTLNGLDMRIFVVNPAGIVFGAGSHVNVTQLVASGLNMSDTDFLNATGSSPTDFRFEGGNGTVTSRAIINADRVYLVGKKVASIAGIVAPNGLVVLAAGDNVYLAQDGSNVIVQLLEDPLDTTADIQNRSVINASNGKIVLAAGDTFSRAITNVGILSASSGTVTARAARIQNDGVINVSAGSSANADGGTVNLTGVHGLDVAGNISADAGANGKGGNITLESDGTVTIGTDPLISARGGSSTGDGGSVKIAGEHFTIAGEIDASPANTDYEPGTLEVEAVNVTIANGANAGAMDTLYEQDIETMGSKGTGVTVYAAQSLTVEDIVDNKIAGRYGDVEFHTTGAYSSLSFADVSDTISTTLGDIILEAGSGGMTIGNLETARDVSDIKPTPGQIVLSTHDRGDITVENLTIISGWGHAEINVSASDDLTVNGNVTVGSELSPIQNVPNGQNAEAVVILKAGDNVALNGDVKAYSDGLHEAAEGSVTRSYIGVFSGTNEVSFGDATINGDLVAAAKSSSQGTSEATVEIDVWGALSWGPEAADPVADADNGQVRIESKETAEETSPDGDIARVIVKAANNAPKPDVRPDLVETHMGVAVEGNVLENDVNPTGAQLTVALVDGPTQAVSFTLNADGRYSYKPKAGYVGGDSFTYTASANGTTSNPATVTITMTNRPPEPGGEGQTTHMGAPLETALVVTDPDGDPIMMALVTGTEHGTLTLNPDGTYTYQPQAGYIGPDTFTYSAVDDQIGAEPVQATLTITVTNPLPTGVSDSTVTTYASPIVINVLRNDTDPDKDPLSVSSFSYTGSGTLVLNANGTFTYTPAMGFLGKDSFTYSVTDGQIGAELTKTTVIITVNIGRLPPPEFFMPTGPDLDKSDVKSSGCTALMKWAAAEFGADGKALEVWIVNGLASGRGIPPCEACGTLRRAATTLSDAQGIYATALAQVINEFASNVVPPSQEQMASIADAIASRARTGNRYALAAEYLTALSDYVRILNSEIGFSVEDSVKFAADRYIAPLARSGKADAAAYVAARLNELGVFLSLSHMEPAQPPERPVWRPTFDLMQ